MRVKKVSFLMAFFLCFTFMFSGCGYNAQEKLDDMIQTSYTEIDDVLCPIYDSIVTDVLGKVYDQGKNYVAYHMWDLGEIQNDGIKDLKLAMFYQKDGAQYYIVYDVTLNKTIKIKKLLSTSIKSDDYVFEPIYVYNFQQDNYAKVGTERIEKTSFLSQTLNAKTNTGFGNLPESLNGGTLEFGETLALPIPELPEGDYAYSVDYRGPIGGLITKEIFQPKREGTYTIVYSLYQTSNPTEVVDQKEFTLEVKDTTNPTVRVEWDLDASYKKGESVMIPVFTADDYSGINLDDSSIVISTKSSFRRTINGDEMATEFEKGENGGLYVPLNYNEVYTVKYTVYDNSRAQNSTIIKKTINVGDLVAPTITLLDNFVPSNVKIDTTLTLNIAGTRVTDIDGDGEFVEFTDDQIKDRISIKVVGPNNETLKNLNVDENNVVIKDGVFKYYIDSVGTYTVTISLKDDAGRTGEVTRTFIVAEKTPSGINSYAEQIIDYIDDGTRLAKIDVKNIIALNIVEDLGTISIENQDRRCLRVVSFSTKGIRDYVVHIPNVPDSQISDCIEQNNVVLYHIYKEYNFSKNVIGWL